MSNLNSSSKSAFWNNPHWNFVPFEVYPFFTELDSFHNFAKKIIFDYYMDGADLNVYCKTDSHKRVVMKYNPHFTVSQHNLSMYWYMFGVDCCLRIGNVMIDVFHQYKSRLP